VNIIIYDLTGFLTCGYVGVVGKRIFIVHHWQGEAEDDWRPWAKIEFEKKGYEVVLLEMPEAYNPRIETWVPYLAASVGEVDEETILVGHGIGAQTVLRYLEALPEGQKSGLAVCVAGWFVLSEIGMPTPEEKELARPWIETVINFEKVKEHVGKVVAIMSSDDPRVPFMENKKIFEEKLGAQIIEEKGKGHFDDGFGVIELPVLLEVIV
jgi:uncharacterized protein